MRRSSLHKYWLHLLICSGFMVLTNSTSFAQSQRYVQIDVRIVGGNPAGLEGTYHKGEIIQAWDTSFFNDVFVPPDLKICIENNGQMKCVEGNCPDLYFCSFIGVPISANTFKLEVWDADVKSDFDEGNDLIGEGVCGINRACRNGQAVVQVTTIPCDDKEIQVNYVRDQPTGHYRFDSGFYAYPIVFGQGSTLSPINPEYHHYRIRTAMCSVSQRGCDVKTVFDTMISRVSFIAPSNDETPVVNCKVNLLERVVGQNPVRTVIDAKNATIVNYTLEAHIFYPGKITRRVVQEGGTIFVMTEGEGFGQYASFNMGFGAVLFKSIDEKLADTVKKRLSLLNKPANQKKPLKNVKNRRRA